MLRKNAFTLVEIIIASFIGGIVMLGVATFVMQTVSSQTRGETQLTVQSFLVSGMESLLRSLQGSETVILSLSSLGNANEIDRIVVQNSDEGVAPLKVLTLVNDNPQSSDYKTPTLESTNLDGREVDHGFVGIKDFSLFNAVVADTNYLYYTDTGHHQIKSLNLSTSEVAVVAGTAEAGFADGAGVGAAQFLLPGGLAIQGSTLYVADTGNHRIRQIDLSSGMVTTIAGTGVPGYTDGDALSARLNSPLGLFFDSGGDALYIADADNQKIRKLNLSTGVMTSVTGSAQFGFGGEGVDAGSSQVQLKNPSSVVVDVSGNIFFTDTGNNRIRKISSLDNKIRTIAGGASRGYAGDGGQAIHSQLAFPTGLILRTGDTGKDELLFSDSANHRVRRIYDPDIADYFPPRFVFPYYQKSIKRITYSIPDALSYIGTPALSGVPGVFSCLENAEPRTIVCETTSPTPKLDDTDIALTGISDSSTAPGIYTISVRVEVEPAELLPIFELPVLKGDSELGTADDRIETIIGSDGVNNGFGPLYGSDFAPTASEVKLSFPTGLAVSGGDLYFIDSLKNRIRKVSDLLTGLDKLQTLESLGASLFWSDTEIPDYHSIDPTWYLSNFDFDHLLFDGVYDVVEDAVKLRKLSIDTNVLSNFAHTLRPYVSIKMIASNLKDTAEQLVETRVATTVSIR